NAPMAATNRAHAAARRELLDFLFKGMLRGVRLHTARKYPRYVTAMTNENRVKPVLPFCFSSKTVRTNFNWLFVRVSLAFLCYTPLPTAREETIWPNHK